MNRLYCFAIFVSFVQVAFAQNPKGSGKIYGTVLDANTKEGVQYATVSLINLTTNKPIDGTITDEKGKFELVNVPVGSFKISVNFISYQIADLSPLTITDFEKIVDAGIINLTTDTKQLKEVEVTGQKVLIEEKIDRIVYNAENDATSKGGDASDVMKKVPLLSVDLDGNVSLRGSQNIKILINNRPSTLSAGSVADALKQIPADLIKSVEVITAPSSKYDAEGSAGIININLKKNTLEGVYLNIDAGAGLRGSNLGLNGNLNRKKMRFSLGGFGRGGYNIPGSFKNSQITTDPLGNVTRNTQTANTQTENLFGRYNFGWDYDINEHNFITGSVQYGTRNNWITQKDFYTSSEVFKADTLFSQNKIKQGYNSTDVSQTVDVSLNYTHTFKKPQQELSFLSLYSLNERNNNFTTNTLDENTNNIIGLRKNINPSNNQELSFQADYQTPVSKNQLIEVGAKTIFRKVESDYQTQIETVGGANLQNPQNKFLYNQNIAAGYATYNLSMPKIVNVKAGMRVEYTSIDATKNGASIPISPYPVYVPSLILSRKLKNGSTIKGSYSLRIQRPSIQFLNPNVQNANILSATSGNPSLKPEYTNNYELSYSTNINKTFITIATFARNTTGAIQSLKTTGDNGVINTTYKNIGSEDAYGMNVFANINISNKLSLSGGTDMYYAILNNNTHDASAAHNEGFVYSGRAFGNYSLPKDWGLQLFAFYRANQVQLQGFQSGFGSYSLSLKKDFNDKKGSIGFGAENFFTPQIVVNTSTKSTSINNTIDQSSSNITHNLSFRINFSYKIGKTGSSETRQRKSLQNDDLKEGGNDGPGGGGGGMQGGGGGQGGSPSGIPAGGNRRNGNTPQGGIPSNGKEPGLVPKDSLGGFKYGNPEFRKGEFSPDSVPGQNDTIPNKPLNQQRRPVEGKKDGQEPKKP